MNKVFVCNVVIEVEHHIMKCIQMKLRFKRALKTTNDDICGVEDNLTPTKRLASNYCIEFLMKFRIKTTLIIPIGACYYSELRGAIMSYSRVSIFTNKSPLTCPDIIEYK